MFICIVERLNVKQRRSRWDGSLSRLIWIYAVCKSLLLSPVAVKELKLSFSFRESSAYLSKLVLEIWSLVFFDHKRCRKWKYLETIRPWATTGIPHATAKFKSGSQQWEEHVLCAPYCTIQVAFLPVPTY